MKNNIKKRIAAILCSLAVSVPTVTSYALKSENNLKASASFVSSYIQFDYNTYYYYNRCSSVPLYVQYGNNTCWAYVMRALTMYKYSYYPNDNEILTLAYNYTNTTGQNAFTDMGNALTPIDYLINDNSYLYFIQNYFGNAYITYHFYQSLNETLIASSINVDKPIIMLCDGLNSSAGHIMLLVGYFSTFSNGSGIAYVEAYDPFDGTTRVLPVVNGAVTYTAQNGVSVIWNKSILI